MIDMLNHPENILVRQGNVLGHYFLVPSSFSKICTLNLRVRPWRQRVLADKMSSSLLILEENRDNILVQKFPAGLIYKKKRKEFCYVCTIMFSKTEDVVDFYKQLIYRMSKYCVCRCKSEKTMNVFKPEVDLFLTIMK